MYKGEWVVTRNEDLGRENKSEKLGAKDEEALLWADLQKSFNYDK